MLSVTRLALTLPTYPGQTPARIEQIHEMIGKKRGVQMLLDNVTEMKQSGICSNPRLIRILANFIFIKFCIVKDITLKVFKGF